MSPLVRKLFSELFCFDLLLLVAVRSYYEHNGTNIFTFETKFSKAAADHAWNTSVSIDFLSTWSLRTVLICADAFPTVLKRTEVTETRTEEVSPVEKALANVEQSVQELQTLARKYTALQNVCSQNDFFRIELIVRFRRARLESIPIRFLCR